MSTSELDVFARAADLFDPPKTGATAHHDDPVGFARDCILWGEGEGLTEYQERNMRSLVEKKRLAVRGPHGLGKTTGNAILTLWFAITRDVAGEDWKVATTASAWRQLEKYLWPEIHKWAKKLNWKVIGREPFSPRELMTLSLKMAHGEAFAAACEDPAKIEGAHADQVLFIFDEAKTIPGATFDAAEGAFSGGGADTKMEAYVLASSTPGEPSGRFYEIHKQQAGLEDWTPIHVRQEEVIAAGRMSTAWARNRLRQWGGTSTVYLNRVKGEFAESDADGIIPLRWVEYAMDRWEDARQNVDTDTPLTIGADIARSGDDRTIVTKRFAWTIQEIRRLPKQGTMETAGMIDGVLQAHHHPARQSTAVIDVIGIGAGVVDRLRETSPENIVPFNASEKTERKDSSGELSMLNCRAGAWWNLRELLDPDSGIPVAFGSDDSEIANQIIGDLTAPKWTVMSGGKIQLESKDQIKKRIGRSTDVGDAIVMAFWTTGGIASAIQDFVENTEAGFFADTPGPSRWALGSPSVGGFAI